MQPGVQERLSFEEFTLDIARGCLSAEGGAVELRPKLSFSSRTRARRPKRPASRRLPGANEKAHSSRRRSGLTSNRAARLGGTSTIGEQRLRNVEVGGVADLRPPYRPAHLAKPRRRAYQATRTRRK
jgi:hypothetical protein